MFKVELKKKNSLIYVTDNQRHVGLLKKLLFIFCFWLSQIEEKRDFTSY